MTDAERIAATLQQLTAIIPGDPVGWSVWTRQGPQPPSHQRMQAWQAQIQAYLRHLWGNRGMIAGGVVLDTTFYRRWPQSAPQKQRDAMERYAIEHITKRPDTDNYRKAFTDACQGILFEDDAQVVWGGTGKLYTSQWAEGFTEITVYPWEPRGGIKWS